MPIFSYSPVATLFAGAEDDRLPSAGGGITRGAERAPACGDELLHPPQVGVARVVAAPDHQEGGL